MEETKHLKLGERSEESDDFAFKGVSARFTALLDLAGVPSANFGRYTWGAKKFSVSKSTFSTWCNEGKLPRRWSDLYRVVELILAHFDPSPNTSPEVVIAWLLTGEGYPFGQDDSALMLCQLLDLMSDVALKKGFDIRDLPLELRTELAKKAMRFVKANNISLTADSTTNALIRSYLGDMFDIALNPL